MCSNDVHTINQKINIPLLEDKKIALYIKREDQIHPEVSGNKYRKLKYNILRAKVENAHTVLTFGGAYSNHILATAVAGDLAGLKTIGVIRGEELGKDIAKTLATNPTLQQAHNHGMQFVFISREMYRTKHEPNFLRELKEKYGSFYLVPEGGTNELAIKGCEEILTKEDASFDYICCCVGTGGTISGLINTARDHQKVLGFPALKGDFLRGEIENYTKDQSNWDLITRYHFGGYAKYQPTLIHFINSFKSQTGIPLDPVYTGKMVFGIIEMIQKGMFKEGSKILMIHTGGLQGIQGFNRMLSKREKELQIIL